MVNVNPVPRVELSLDDPNVASPTYIDISSFVLEEGIQTTRGRNSELDRFQAGTGSIMLDNRDGRFDPTFAGAIQNLVTNPSVEINTTGYGPFQGTIARSALAAAFGGFGLILTTQNVSSSEVYWDKDANTGLIPGLPYTFSLSARLAGSAASTILSGGMGASAGGILSDGLGGSATALASKSFALQIDFYNGASLVNSAGTVITINSTTMTRFSVMGTAGAGVDRAYLVLATNGAQGVFDLYTDGWQFEQASTALVYNGVALSYNDGSQSNGRWEGTPHASRSYFGGPHYPNLRPMNRIKISDTWASINYPQMVGYTNGWTPTTPGPLQSVVVLQITDAFAVLAIPTLTQVPVFVDDAPTNLLRNPSAEDDTDDYLANAASIAQLAAAAKYGDWGIDLLTTNVTNSHVRYDRDSNISVIPGQTYTASAFVALAVAAAKSFTFHIDFYNGVTLVNSVSTTVALTTTAWVRVFVSGVAGANTDRASIIFGTNGAQGAIHVYLDAFQFEVLAANLGELPEERSDLRLGRVLDAVGWLTADRVLSAGASILLEQTGLNGVTALSELQLIEQSENGRLWIDTSGRVKFLSRWDMGLSPYTVSQATFGQTGSDLRYVNVTPSYDLTFIHNEIRMTGIQIDAVEQVARDATSTGHYYTRTLTETGLLVSDNELFDAVAYEIDRYGTVHLRFLTLDLEGRADPTNQWPQILGRQISDRITVKFTPPGSGLITQECFIEGITLNWTHDLWQATFQLSAYGVGYLIYPSGKTFFELGHATNGKIGAAQSGVLVY